MPGLHSTMRSTEHQLPVFTEEHMKVFGPFLEFLIEQINLLEELVETTPPEERHMEDNRAFRKLQKVHNGLRIIVSFLDRKPEEFENDGLKYTIAHWMEEEDPVVSEKNVLEAKTLFRRLFAIVEPHIFDTVSEDEGYPHALTLRDSPHLPDQQPVNGHIERNELSIRGDEPEDHFDEHHESHPDANAENHYHEDDEGFETEHTYSDSDDGMDQEALREILQQ